LRASERSIAFFFCFLLTKNAIGDKMKIKMAGLISPAILLSVYVDKIYKKWYNVRENTRQGRKWRIKK